MPIPLHILILEDRASDAELLLYELRKAGFEPHGQRVDTEPDYLAHLHEGLDVIFADYALPQFDALRALHLLAERGLDIPFVIVSGAISEEVAVECMKQGAADYLLKDRLARLGQAVEHTLAAKRLRDEKRRADEEFQVMSGQLWQTAKLATMGELAASIAHELNNPLATVSLRIELLLAHTPAPDPRRRALEIVEQEVDRMGNLVASLLQFSRRSQPEISSVDVREEIGNSLALIHYHLRDHRITVVRQFAPDVPMVYVDRQQLRQVFLNLLMNASDAMPQGGTLAIRLATSGLDTGAALVIIEFIDTGVGIAPEDLPKVMEPFFTTKAEGKGTGLGLAICRRIMQEHQGTFEISSASGQGTTVRLALPITNGRNRAYLQGTDA